MIGSVRVLESRFVQSCTSIANAPQISNAEIAILGRSNVGKSSLINALLNNKNLAKSSSTPGKTRLVNVFVSKWQINLLNSSLGAPCGDFENLGRFADAPVQSHAPNSQKTPQFPPQILELDLKANSAKSSLRGSEADEAIQDFCDSKNDKFNRASAQPKKASSGVGEGVVREGRGERLCNSSPHPLPQKKRALNNMGFDADLSADLRKSIDSSESPKSQNVDCFGDESPRNDESIHDSHKSPQDEFAQKFVIHILDFPGFGYARVSKAERDSWDKNLSTFLKKRESIKLFIHLIDSRHTNLALDNEIRAFLRSIVRADADILEVFTKADKLKKSEIHALKGRILVSTTKKDLGQGDLKDSIESLRHAILRTMYHI